MSKYSYYDADGKIISVKTLKDEEEAKLNMGRADGFVEGSYAAHLYCIEDGKPVAKDPRNPVWPTPPE
mgnify:FL=1